MWTVFLGSVPFLSVSLGTGCRSRGGASGLRPPTVRPYPGTTGDPFVVASLHVPWAPRRTERREVEESGPRESFGGEGLWDRSTPSGVEPRPHTGPGDDPHDPRLLPEPSGPEGRGRFLVLLPSGLVRRGVEVDLPTLDPVGPETFGHTARCRVGPGRP